MNKILPLLGIATVVLIVILPLSLLRVRVYGRKVDRGELDQATYEVTRSGVKAQVIVTVVAVVAFGVAFLVSKVV